MATAPIHPAAQMTAQELAELVDRGARYELVEGVLHTMTGGAADTIAVVSTIGHGGFLLGPPLLGVLAAAVALDRALLMVAVLAALISVLAGIARERPAQAPVAL